MELQSKVTVYVAIAGVFALLGGIIFYANLDIAELDQVEIQLDSVKLRVEDMTSKQAKFDVTFLIKNPSSKTLSVSIIDFKLYGDEQMLGQGLYSSTDVALPGRALFYPGAEILLKSTFTLDRTDANAEIYEKAVNEKIVNFYTEGTITAQSSWSQTDNEFKTGY